MSPSSVASVFSLPLLVFNYSRGVYEGRDILYNYMQEYQEVEFVEKSFEPKQRSATGRVFTGNCCEYIKLGSVTANEDCTDGE
jgi:hypothetical protein